MENPKDQFQEFVSNPQRRRLYEREALALEASEVVSSLMKEENVSKTELAHLVGTSKSNITNILSGSRNMTMYTLADLTFALGYRVEIKASPLSDVACWVDMGESYTETYPDEWKRSFDAFKAADYDDAKSHPQAGKLEDCQFAFAS